MARLAPGVYTYDVPNSNLASSLSGYNITAVIGVGKNWKQRSSIEIIKSKVENAQPTSNQLKFSDVQDKFIGYELIPLLTNVLPITEDNAGYYFFNEREGNYDGRATVLEVVANDTENIDEYQIKLEDVTPWKETDEVQIGDRVVKVNNGDYFQVNSDITGAKLIIPDIVSKDIIDSENLQFNQLISITSLGSLPGLNEYKLNQDYIIEENDKGDAVIVWTFGFPEVGSSFYVSYRMYKDDDDYEPKYKYSTDAIKNEYGPEYNNGVINSLTLAADLVIEGQTVFGGGVLCCQVKNPDQISSWYEAIDKLDNKVFNTYILTNQNEDEGRRLQSYLQQKIQTLASEVYKTERTAFYIPPFNDWDIQNINDYRSALSDERITLFANKKCTIELTDDTTLNTEYIELPAVYACANLSGIEGNPEYTFSEPMLRKNLSSRITLNEEQRFNPSEKFSLDNNGVSIFDINVLTNITFVYVIGTTDMTNVMTETRAVRRETDLLRQNVRRNLDQYIGQKNKPLTASSATQTTKALLSNFVNIDEIGDYREVTSWFDENEPRLLMQSFSYRPYLETRWIKVYIGTYI